MKVSKKTQQKLNAAPTVAEVKGGGMVAKYEERLAAGEKRVSDLMRYLEDGGYRPTRAQVEALAVGMGLVQRHYGRFPGLVVPREVKTETKLQKALKAIDPSQAAKLAELLINLKNGDSAT